MFVDQLYVNEIHESSVINVRKMKYMLIILKTCLMNYNYRKIFKF